jgi:hypothetical protein
MDVFKASAACKRVPEPILAMIDQRWDQRVAYRRRDFEAAAMMKELCARAAIELPSTLPRLAITSPVSAPEVSVFLITTREAAAIAQLVKEDLESSGSPQIRVITGDLAALPTADKVRRLELLLRSAPSSPPPPSRCSPC